MTDLAAAGFLDMYMGILHVDCPYRGKLRASPSGHETRAAPQGAAPGFGADTPARNVRPYAVWMLLTAILPERRSSAVSKETFWPSTSPRSPARSSAVAWTNTSLPPLSGWMKPKPF